MRKKFRKLSIFNPIQSQIKAFNLADCIKCLKCSEWSFEKSCLTTGTSSGYNILPEENEKGMSKSLRDSFLNAEQIGFTNFHHRHVPTNWRLHYSLWMEKQLEKSARCWRQPKSKHKRKLFAALSLPTSILSCNMRPFIAG